MLWNKFSLYYGWENRYRIMEEEGEGIGMEGRFCVIREFLIILIRSLRGYLKKDYSVLVKRDF